MPIISGPVALLDLRLQEELAREYRSHKTRPNLVQLLSLDPANHRVRLWIKRVHFCRPQNRCLQIDCPNCGRKPRRNEVKQAMLKVLAIAGVVPQPNEISAITINGPMTKHGAAAREAMISFRKRLYTLSRRRLASISCQGFFDISADGRVHFHGLFYHPFMPLSDLLEILRDQFRDGRAIWVSSWKANQPMLVAMSHFLWYATASPPRVPRDKRDRKKIRINASRLMGERLISRKSMSTSGYFGLRISMSTRSSSWRATSARRKYSSEIDEIIRVLEEKLRPRKNEGQSPWLQNTIRQRTPHRRRE